MNIQTGTIRYTYSPRHGIIATLKDSDGVELGTCYVGKVEIGTSQNCVRELFGKDCKVSITNLDAVTAKFQINR